MSLALVLAMALTLLPTAALAGTAKTQAHNQYDAESTCNGNVTWTPEADGSGHKISCDGVGCEAFKDSTAENHQWKTGTCELCGYDHPNDAHTPQTGTAQASTAGSHTYTCNDCGKENITGTCAAAQTPTYTAGTT